MTLEQLLQLVEERVLHRFYGKYAGVVRDVEDPLGIGRLRALVPSVLGEDVETGWALPCAPFGGGKNRGMLFMPEPGDTVWVEFLGGDVSQPVWSGAFWGAPESSGQQDDLAEETGAEVPTTFEDKPAGPGLHVLRTKANHCIALDDEGDIVVTHGQGKTEVRLNKDDEVLLKSEKAELRLKQDGGVVVKTEKATLTLAQDGTVTLKCEEAVSVQSSKDVSVHSTGGKVTVEAQSEVTVEAPSIKFGESATQPLVLGNDFLTLFNQHIHSTGVGPSGPPTPKMVKATHLSGKSSTE